MLREQRALTERIERRPDPAARDALHYVSRPEERPFTRWVTDNVLLRIMGEIETIYRDTGAITRYM